MAEEFDALAMLRARNRYDVELPSGLWATIRLPRVEECMAAGGVPFALLLKVSAQLRTVVGRDAHQPAGAEVTQEELERLTAYHNELVRRSLVRLAETAEALADMAETEFDVDVIRELPEEDWQAIVLWAGRDKPIPKAEGSTSNGSRGSSPPPTGGSSPASPATGDETLLTG